ncbi:cell envelope integrity protein CreD [Pseudoduganella violacea]|uniref:Inner membrane protein n=1 Tax=Pseudoduganella violacea TaxID=1715466 RepID=A0A7W5BBN6_9BURK|nr:cell envelope integrity protein CreD [Pseudoduganella violacea]MBB3120159.1 inner membrane protein [Pseudoduganella violacea]
MQKKLLFKILIIIGLMLMIGLPLMMIQATINERSAYREQAVRSIAADSVGEQTVYGPVLVLPYTDEYEQMEEGGEDKPRQLKKYRVQRRHLVFPNQLNVAGVIGTERRYRGIHQVLVYNGEHKFSGDFVLPSLSELPRAQAQSHLTPGQPFLALGVSDVRGVRDIPKILWGQRLLEFEQGSGLTGQRQGLHVPLEMSDVAAGSVKFSFNLGLAGIESQQFVPLAKNNRFTLTSPWPHPQFGGRFLPAQRSISERGFEATWRISALSSDAQQQLRQAELRAQEANSNTPAGALVAAGALDAFSVDFIEPVNIYSMAERATKYGLLFVVLTFAAFFLFEVLKRLPIHPVQYGLVGLALAMFFLLLVSLSEHMPFLVAYLLASVACIVLIGFYLGHALGDRRRGWGFGVALSLLYGILYGLLNSENNALLMGAILLFAVLAAVMVATRKVDWYDLAAEPPLR